MSSIAGGGGSKPPDPPPFHPIDIPKLSDRAMEQDLRRYFSMQFPVFPGMTDVRQREIEDAYKQLTSPLSSEFQNAFVRNATTTQQQVTGGGDPYSAMGLKEGSFGKGAMSASYTRQVLAKQDYDRARFEGLQQQNPIPGIGLSQNDLLSLYVYNTGAQNAFSMANYANQIAGANSAYAAQQQDFNSIGSLISGLGSIYSNYQMNNNSGVPSNYGQGFYG
jgi:hypothetical protein